ncbi:MAG: serine--tRNA ligase, partial [Bradyrhizobium sp.]|uniref:serine--tRNA ligase n=1 Tax=Bradyrhizobium sp. TaxID=376 RepID=UPI002730CE71
MHDIKSIRDNPGAFDAGLKRRGLEPLANKLIEIDEKRRMAIGHLERMLARRNEASKEIGEAKKRKDDAHAEDLMIEVMQLKKAIPELEKTPRELEAKLEGILAAIPNLPLDDVPEGVDEHGNVQRHVFGEIRNYAFTPKPHDDIGSALGFMDFEAAAKLSGARFVVLKKGLARLERAIGQFMLDLHTNEHGYSEINPPLLVRDDIMKGTGQLPKFQYDQFVASRISVREDLLADALQNIDEEFEKRERKGSIKKLIDELLDKAPTKEDFWLIPTAEVPLTNLVRESILDEKELPMRLTALTPCFRAEAGAAGRDTRGMIRQHQFTKVELVSIATPENGKHELERMLACAEEVLRRLDLHYRVMTLCAGDMGFSAQKTYDIEVWMPGQGEGGAYREISSCSLCGDFQARRMDAR